MNIVNHKRRKLIIRNLGMACLALIFCVPSAVAGGGGGIGGKVLDASGGAVPGVEITVTNAATGKVAAHATTGSDGIYSITGLASGTYTLQAVKAGFLIFNRKETQIRTGQTVTADITLKVASLVQSVVVKAAAPKTSVTAVTITKGQIQAVGGPIGGAAQALSAAPGINIYGYGGIAATARDEIVMRGIKAG